MCTNDPADTGEVKKERDKQVDSSALRAAEIKKKTGWHRDEIAPANLLKNEFGGAFLYPYIFAQFLY